MHHMQTRVASCVQGFDLSVGECTAERGLDGGPSLSDGKCRLLSVLHERAYELLGMVSWEASGLENQSDEVEMWTLVS